MSVSLSVDTSLSLNEIDAIFDSSYLSYVSEMKSMVSSFEPSSAGKRAREESSSSPVSKKKGRLEKLEQLQRKLQRKRKREEEQDIREDTFAIKDEAYLFYALPDKKLSQTTNKFVQEYNKKKSLLYAPETVTDNNVIHKRGDLPCERYFAHACRKFENVVTNNDKVARKKADNLNIDEGYPEDDSYPEGESLKEKVRGIVPIVEAGKEFVEDLMKILFQYKGIIDLNRLEDAQFDVSQLDVGKTINDDSTSKNFNQQIYDKIKNYWDTMKVTDQGFLGLSEENLRLQHEMKKRKFTKKFYSMFQQEEQETEKNLKLFSVDENQNVVLNVLGAIPLIDKPKVDEERSDDSIFLKTVDLPFFNERKKSYTKLNLFDVNAAVTDTVPGILSMDRLLYYLYKHFLLKKNNENVDLDKNNDTRIEKDKIKLKNDFEKSVKSYKEIERQKTLSLIQDNFDNYRIDPLLDYLKSHKLPSYLTILHNTNKTSEYEDFDVFKLLFQVDKHLSQTLRLQYFKNKKFFVGEIFIKGDPDVQCVADLNDFFKKINSDLKDFWQVLFENLEDYRSPNRDILRNDYGIVFPKADDSFPEFNDRLFGFLKMYLGQTETMEKQQWKSIDRLLSEEAFEDFFDENIKKESIIRYMFDTREDIVPKLKNFRRNIDIDMLLQMYKNVNAFNFNTVKDSTDFAENLWDHFYDKFTEEKKGLFQMCYKYNNGFEKLLNLQNKFKNIKEGEQTQNTEKQIEDKNSELNSKRLKILNTKFDSFTSVKVRNEGVLLKILQELYGEANKTKLKTLEDTEKREAEERLAKEMRDEAKKFKTLRLKEKLEAEERLKAKEKEQQEDLKKSNEEFQHIRFTSYTNVLFPLSEQELESISIFSESFVKNIKDYFKRVTVWDQELKKDITKTMQGNIKKKVEKLQSELDVTGNQKSLRTSYQQQLKEKLFMLKFDTERTPDGKLFYYSVKKKPVKDINNPKKGMTFIQYLIACLKRMADSTLSRDQLIDDFKKLNTSRDRDTGKVQIFHMFFNTYFSNSDTEVDYRILDKTYNPENKEYFRNRFLFFKDKSFDSEATDYIKTLIRDINVKGEEYNAEDADAEKLEQELQQLTKDLNVMLTLYNYNDATAVRICASLFYIVATSFEAQINWDKSTKINAAALLKLFCKEDIYEGIDFNKKLEELINIWNADVNSNDDERMKMSINDLQQAVEGENLFGLMPKQKFEDHATVGEVANGEQSGLRQFRSTDNISVDYKFESVADNGETLLRIEKKDLDNTKKTLISILLDSKVQLQLCAYKQILDAINSKSDFEVKYLQEDEKDLKKRRTMNALIQNEVNIETVEELNNEYNFDDFINVEESRLPTPYNNKIQEFGKERNNYKKNKKTLKKMQNKYYALSSNDTLQTQDEDKWNEDVLELKKEINSLQKKLLKQKKSLETLEDNLVVYEKGDLVIFKDFIYEYIFPFWDESEIKPEELVQPDKDKTNTIWKKIERSEVFFKMREKAMKVQVKVKILKGSDDYSKKLLIHKMENILPKKAKPLKYIITSLTNSKNLNGNDDGNQIVDALNTCLADLNNALTKEKKVTNIIQSWFSRRKNVIDFHSSEDFKPEEYTDFELFYGTQKQDVWNMENTEDELMGLLNYSYSENKDDKDGDVWKQDEVNLQDDDFDPDTMKKKVQNQYLFKNLENVADWVKKKGQENLFYSRNYVEQIKSLLKDFLLLADNTSSEFEKISKAKTINMNAFANRNIGKVNSFCKTASESTLNDRIKKKIQLFCEFHRHLSNVVYGLKLQVLKLYNEGICETVDYNKDSLRKITRYNIIFNELSANLKTEFEPRKKYLEFLKEDGFHNPNIENNSHIEKRRKRYKSLKPLDDVKDLSKIRKDIETYFTESYAVLPDWFYNRLLDTYVVFHKDIDTIISNFKIPFKLRGFNFALLLQDAFETYADEVSSQYDNNIFTYTNTSWNKDNKNQIANYTPEQRERQLIQGPQNFKLSDIEKNNIQNDRYSMVRDYKFQIVENNKGEFEVSAITKGNNCCLLGIQEFVKEVNYHLFLDEDNEGRFLQKYLWNIFRFESRKYEDASDVKMLDQIKITKDYICEDGYDKDVIVYKKNSKKEKILFDEAKHGVKVAEYSGRIIRERRKVANGASKNTSFRRMFLLTKQGNLFYGKKREESETDINFYEIYKSPSLVINTLTKKYEPKKNQNKFHIISTDEEGNSEWIECENTADTCVFDEKNKELKVKSSFYYGIDTTLKLIDKYINQYEKVPIGDADSVNVEDNEGKLAKNKKISSFFTKSFEQMKTVLKNLREWFSDGNEKGGFTFNKFRIVTPTIDYMSFFKKMHYQYKSIKGRLLFKYRGIEKKKIRQNDLENFFLASLIEEFNDEFYEYRDKLQRLEYCMMARYSLRKDQEPAYNNDQKKAFIKSLSSSMLVDALVQRNSIGDRLIKNTFLTSAKDNYLIMPTGSNDELLVEDMELSLITNFEDTCLKLILKQIQRSILKYEKVVKQVSVLDISRELNISSRQKGKRGKTLAQYSNDVKNDMKEFIDNLLRNGKENSSLEKFKVDLYTKDEQNEKKFKKKLRLLYLKTKLNSKSAFTLKNKKSKEQFTVQNVSFVHNNTKIKFKVGNDEENDKFKTMNIKDVFIRNSELKKIAKAYVTEGMLIQKFQFDDILLANVDYNDPDKELIQRYRKYFEKITTDASNNYKELKEIFHLFCGIENNDGTEIEVYGILYYIQLLYKLVYRERRKICEVHEGCHCVVVKANGEKDTIFNDEYYTVEEIVDDQCSLRDLKGHLLRDKSGNVDYVPIEKLINLNKTTSAPFVTVRKKRSEKNGKAKDVRKFHTFKYVSRYASLKNNNYINLLDKDDSTTVVKKIEESKLLLPDNFILLAENQVGAYNGSELDIFYNIKLLAMEQQLDNLISVLTLKLSEIEDVLKNNNIIPKNKKNSTKMVYRSLFQAVKDERDLIAFWKSDIIKYDPKVLLESDISDLQQAQMLEKIIEQQEKKQKEVANESTLKIQDLQEHYKNNFKALAYKNVVNLKLKDTNRQQQLEDQQKVLEDRKKKTKKKDAIKKISSMKVLKLPNKTSEVMEEKSDTISANVLSKMIKLMI